MQNVVRFKKKMMFFNVMMTILKAIFIVKMNLEASHSGLERSTSEGLFFLKGSGYVTLLTKIVAIWPTKIWPPDIKSLNNINLSPFTSI